MRLVPTDLAALALGVRPATIRQWCKRGILTRHGTARQAMWSLAELQRLDATRRINDRIEPEGKT